MFDDITAEPSFTRIEEEVRRFWRRHAVPEAFRAARRDGPTYVLHLEPLLPAGQSPMDQVRLLATADLLLRYRALRDDAVHLGVGWACHDPQVQVAVERSLAADLAGYDLARFVAACRDAATEGMRRGEALAERLAVWTDPAGTYATMSPQAIGAVWGALRRLWDAGLLKQECRVVPVCPRCATPLSSTEASRRAIQVDAPSIWLCLPWDGEADTYLLLWTQAPWTLLGMVAVALHPEASYVVVEMPGREGRPGLRLLLAEAALERTLAGEYQKLRRLSGKSLRGARYRPLFTFLPAGEKAGGVVLSRDVPLDRGTGLLPVTPAFEAESLALAQRHDLSLPQLLDEGGNLDDAVTPWRGLSPLDAEPLLVENLETRGLLFREQTEARARPLCPYCETPLLSLARDVWLVKTAGGPWIVGHDRAWGAPLPVWVCDRCQEQACVAGLDDLAHRTNLDVAQIVPHRPAVDRLTFPCQACGGTMRRVGPVVDAAFEAAVLPGATGRGAGPADVAVGFGDKHLGWLGDLTEVAALLRGSLAWEQAVALPELEIGPTLDLERALPADALRWAAYADMTPAEAERAFLHPLWRLVLPFLSGPSVSQAKAGSEELFDRWLLARLYQAVTVLTGALDACDPQRAARELGALVDDVSGWYAPHRPGGGDEALGVLCRLLVPFAPHVAEAIYRQAGRRATDSVHLAAWPAPDRAWEDGALLAGMAQVRRLSALGQAARAQAGIPFDEPLRRVIVALAGDDDGGATRLAPFRDLLVEVLGVAALQFTADATKQVVWRLALDAGRAVEREMAPGDIEAAVASLDPEQAAEMAAMLARGLSVSLRVGEAVVTLLPDEVSASVEPRAGWAAAAEAGQLVALEVG
jgi:isoleucyl-tRNA synthetase